jgi:hypothetical protein
MAGNLRRAAEFVEMNLSQMGKDERRTRIGYKDQVRTRWSSGLVGSVLTKVCVASCFISPLAL